MFVYFLFETKHIMGDGGRNEKPMNNNIYIISFIYIYKPEQYIYVIHYRYYCY